MSDLQRTRVHCFLLEENFPFHLLVGCSGRLEQLSHQRVIARHSRSDPSGGKPKSLHRSPPSQSVATQLGVDADCRCAPILRVSAGPGKTVHARFRVSQQDNVPGLLKARPDARARGEGQRPEGEQLSSKEEEGRIRGAAFRTTAGLSPCRRQMPRSSLRAGSLMALFAASRGFRYEMSAGTDRTDAFP